ncbi:MAG: HD-GYP domain-containing protein [Gammaproteobacteria bacterium]|nr:HD-GYP domain-containing protein [Gammaproteobacteria bacterium]
MAVLGITIVFGVLVFLVEYNKVGGLVADRAQRSVAFFNAQTQHLLDQPGLLNAAEFQAALESNSRQARGHEIGRFVSVEITDAGTLRLAELHDPEYAFADEVEAFMQSPSRLIPQQDEDYYENVNIGGAKHVYVVVPMKDSAGETAAYARGVFALSDAAFAQINNRIVTVVGITVALIVATSLLLYPIIARLLKQVSLLSTRLLDANLEMIEVLGSAIAKRDSDTDVHNYRVSIYSVRLAEAIGLDRHSVRSLIKGAFLHDVGKIGISDNILKKPGRLDEQEFEIMKQHVQHGLDIVERSEWLADAATIVGYHHTKFDGSGYDVKWVGEEIPLNARIFAIADVFDALTSERPYKSAFAFDKAMEILDEGSATHFDPALLDAFAGIAESLYRDYANRDDDKPRHDLAEIIDEYFKNEVELVAEIR